MTMMKTTTIMGGNEASSHHAEVIRWKAVLYRMICMRKEAGSCRDGEHVMTATTTMVKRLIAAAALEAALQFHCACACQRERVHRCHPRPQQKQKQPRLRNDERDEL